MKTSDAIEQFLVSRSHCTPKTREWYVYQLNQLNTWVQERDIEDITENDLHRFIAMLQTRERCDLKNGALDAETIGGMVRAIRAFFNWCVESGWIDVSPARRIKEPRVSKPSKALSIPQVNAIEKKLARATWELHERDRAMFYLMVQTGLRASEVTGLTIADVNLSERHMQVIGKGNKRRTVGLTKKSAQMIRRIIGKREAGFVFTTKQGKRITGDGLKSIFRRLSKHLGVHVNTHQLRHTFATVMIIKGASPTNVQTLMGHSDLSVTMRYAEAARVNAAMREQKRIFS
jgi:site-specific recombinase XerD